jgi:hypothetical protein
VPLLIGSETARLAAGRFTVVDLDRTQVKGKTETVASSTVLGKRRDLTRHA